MTGQRTCSTLTIPLRYLAHYLVFAPSFYDVNSGCLPLSARLLDAASPPLRYPAHCAIGEMALTPATLSGANRYVIRRKLQDGMSRLYWLPRPFHVLKGGYVIWRITCPMSEMVLVEMTHPM